MAFIPSQILFALTCGASISNALQIDNSNAADSWIRQHEAVQTSASKYRKKVDAVHRTSELVMKSRIARLNITDDLECDAWNACNEKCITDVSSGDLKFRMTVLHNDRYVSRTALCTGRVWEADTVDIFLDLLSQTKKGNFLDVGANLGSFSLPIGAFMKQRDEGIVVAVEANPDTISVLQESVDVNYFNGTVEPQTIAIVRDTVETPHVCSSVADTLHDSNPGGNQVDLGNRFFGDCPQKIPTWTLDMMYQAGPTIMSQFVIAKLDCEGCEGQALFGGRQLLSEHPPCYLAFEVTEKYLCEGGTSLGEIYKLLEETGYDTAGHPVRPAPQPHGDGSCEGFDTWVSEHSAEDHWAAFSQSFAIFPQKDIQACLSRFA